jgi:hypothetical protein
MSVYTSTEWTWMWGGEVEVEAVARSVCVCVAMRTIRNVGSRFAYAGASSPERPGTDHHTRSAARSAEEDEGVNAGV